MISAQDNELLMHVGPGTPMGKLMREFRVPACLSEAGIPGLIGGAYDIIYGNVVSNLLARQQGLDVMVVSGASKGGFGAILARKDSGVKSGADLHGKALAVNTRNNVIWLYARAWVKVTGPTSICRRCSTSPAHETLPDRAG
jgi:hypothetical protein